MTSQRARVAESRVRNRLSNGPPRVQSKAFFEMPSILQRQGIRQLPRISKSILQARRTAMNQGGTADSLLFVLGRKGFFLSRANFCFLEEIR